MFTYSFFLDTVRSNLRTPAQHGFWPLLSNTEYGHKLFESRQLVQGGALGWRWFYWILYDCRRDQTGDCATRMF